MPSRTQVAWGRASGHRTTVRGRVGGARRARRAGGGQLGRGRDTRGEHADDHVGGLAGRAPPGGRRRPVPARFMAFQLVSPSAGGRSEARRRSRAGPSACGRPSRLSSRAGPARPCSPVSGPASRGWRGGRDHVGHHVVAHPQLAGENHRASRHCPCTSPYLDSGRAGRCTGRGTLALPGAGAAKPPGRPGAGAGWARRAAARPGGGRQAGGGPAAGAASSGHVCRVPPGYVGWVLEPIRACRHPAENGA